jgi:3-deoxy-manno-octulosonate cytidylyltransferase (CMP-KDO synthetase)
MKTIGVLPVRYASSRFPGKPLKEIEGLPMVIHTLKRTQLCKDLDEVYVATDTKEIYDLIESYNGTAIITSDKHKTGTDRIAEAVKDIDCDIVVNIQGDEPLVNPEHISKAVEPLIQDPSVMVSTLLCEINRFNDPTECKVVLDKNNDILYMSREDVPTSIFEKQNKLIKLYCIVPFKKNFLIKFSNWKQTPIEIIEHIEYLRILENGYKMRGVLVDSVAESVDTPENLELVRELMKTDKIKHRYLEKDVQS